VSAGECDEQNHAQWVGGGVNPKCQQKKILKVEIFVIQITVFVFLGLVPFFLPERKKLFSVRCGA